MDEAAIATELRESVGQLVRKLRREYSFSLSQATVLGRLDREGSQCVSDLALAERVRPQSMAQTVADLEEQGLVARSPDPGDRRRAIVELTTAGRERLEGDRREREGRLATAIAEELSAAERETLARALPLLRRLADL